MILPSKETVEFEHRYLIAARAFGMTEPGRMIFGTMLIDTRPWRIQTLADRLHYSRATIRKLLKDLEWLKLAKEIDDEGWVLTESGIEFYSRVFEELVAIANKDQRRFSPDFIDYLVRTVGHHPKAVKFNLSSFHI